jgi:thioredoxin-like negative regulator of GroEL
LSIGVIAASIGVSGCGAEPQPGKRSTTSAGAQATADGDRHYATVIESELGPVVQSYSLVLVEFGDDFSCYRCQQMTPVVNSVQADFTDQAHVVRVPYSPASRLGKSLGLRVCPTYVVFQDGQLVDRVEGSVPAPVLIAKLAARQRSAAAQDARPSPTVPRLQDW